MKYFVAVTICLATVATLVSAGSNDGIPSFKWEDIRDKKVDKYVALSQFADLNLSFDNRVNDFNQYHEEDTKASLLHVQDIAFMNWQNQICRQNTGQLYHNLKRDNFNIFQRRTLLDPKVADFIKAMGYQIMATCRKTMPINAAMLDKALAPNEEALIKRFESIDAFVFGNKADPLYPRNADELLVAAKMLKAIRAGAPSHKKTIPSMSPTSADFLRKFQAGCESVFSTGYERLANTMMDLIELGYDYAPEGNLCTDPSTRRWLNLMVTCEAIKAFDYFKGHHLVPNSKWHQHVDRVGAQTENRLQVSESDMSIHAKAKTADSLASAAFQGLYKTMVTRLSLASSDSKFLIGYVNHLGAKLDNYPVHSDT